MHILVTNDDGIDSPGLFALKTALDPLGDVSVIAPDSNRSATARSITIRRPLEVREVRLPDGSVGYATDGTPVDCVRFAVLGLLGGGAPDVIVSGINHGLNLGDDVTYSGTVAAALEGVLLGWPAIAVSQQAVNGEPWHSGKATYDFTAVSSFVAGLVPVAVRERFPRHVLLNVNAPGIEGRGVERARVTRLGRRIYNDRLELIDEEGGDGRRRYLIYGDNPSHHPEEGTDFAAIEAGEISVTPLHFDLTDIGGMEQLERIALDELLAGPASPGAA
jgi:5'-nucleotidase